MFCPNCGANIPGEYEVCPECGTEFSVRRNHTSGSHEPFIVAEDEGEMHAASHLAASVPGDDDTTSQDPIIEAEEEELPEECELPAEDELPEGTGSGVQVMSANERTDRIIPEDESGSARQGAYPGGEGNRFAAAYSDDRYFKRDGGDARLAPRSSEGDVGLTMPSDEMPVVGADNGAEKKPHPSDSSPLTKLPSSSRKRSFIVSLGVIVFVVLGLAILVYGLPGQGPGDGGIPVSTPLPTPVSDDTPVPVTETAPPWTPSENLLLSISAYSGGYKVEIDGGLMANEVAKIVLTVEDSSGLHTMEWAYPSRRESFFMAREAYNGSASAIEHVTAVATFNDGKKEVVFSGDL